MVELPKTQVSPAQTSRDATGNRLQNRRPAPGKADGALAVFMSSPFANLSEEVPKFHRKMENMWAKVDKIARGCLERPACRGEMVDLA